MKSSNKSKRAHAYKLAKDAAILDPWGKPTDTYNSLIMEVTGKNSMSIMTEEEADKFLEALEKLSQEHKASKNLEQKPFSLGRPHYIPALVVAIMLLVAVAPLPYGYYQFMRWAVCGVAIFIAYKSFTWEKHWAIWVFSAVAILFNPLFPIHLEKEIWQPIDAVCALLFGLSLLLKEPNKE
ncbi:DUF6804 family protein [Chloroflexota bacterium]